MSSVEVLAILSGESTGHATAITWTTVGALRALTWGSGIESEPEALVAVAEAFALDLAFVPAGHVWSTRAVSMLEAAGIAAGWIVSGVMTRACDIIGWRKALELTARAPGELAATLDSVLGDAMNEVRAGEGAGADVLLVADDIAGSCGWLVAPDFAIDALIPCYHHIAESWTTATGPAVFHSDGDVRALMPALRSASFVGIHFGAAGGAGLPSQFGAAHGAGLVPMGGMPARSLLENGATRTAESAAQLLTMGSCVVADDGGLVGAEETAAFGVALQDLRRST